MARKKNPEVEARVLTTSTPPPTATLELAARARQGDVVAERELAVSRGITMNLRPSTHRAPPGSPLAGLRQWSGKASQSTKQELPVAGLATASRDTLFFRGVGRALAVGIEDGRRFEIPFERSTADWPTELLLPFGEQIVIGDVRLGWLERRSAKEGALCARAEIAEPLGFGFSWGAAGDRLAGAPKSGKEIVAYDLGAELGKELWRKGGFKKILDVRVSGSSVYVSDYSSKTLHVLSLEDGELLWEGSGSVDDADSLGALQGSPGWLKELDAKTGVARWQWSPTDGSIKRDAFGTEAVFLARTRAVKTETTTPEGWSQVSVNVHDELAALDRASGKLRFETKVSAEPRTLAVTKDVGYAGFLKEDRSLLLRAIDLATGSELFAADLPVDGTGQITLLPGEGRLDVIGLNTIHFVPGKKGSASATVEIVTLRS